MPDILSVLDSLKRQRWYQGQIARVEPLPSRSATYAEPAAPLPAELRRYLDTEGIPSLYSHQAEVLDRCRRGENVIITTGTASGKTLAFNLPVFETLLAEPRATALYLYPMKAVTQDQLKILKRMERATGLSLRPAVYDGDTTPDKRRHARATSRLVLSNPYELHQILPYHYQWASFLRGLRYVVIDEAHRYRGVFGSNIAQLLRRLQRILRLYQSDPQFILASASIANPQELAEKLTGSSFSHVGNDGSPRGRGWLVLWNPLKAPDSAASSQAGRLVGALTAAGLQTICFVPSRRLAELISRWVGGPAARDAAVSPYRAGYLAEDRRRIEAELSSGALRGVVSTDALELGIDVGGLDCIVVYGYPGSIASFWQQAGRAGRKLQDSCAVFIGMPDALNQYLLRSPEVLLARAFESAVIDLHNPYITSGHLLCAASESPLRTEEIAPEAVPLVGALEEKLLLSRTPVGWVYSGKERPQEKVALDAIEETSVEVVCDGRVIEVLDRARACRDAHTGAVLLHQGETYVVKSLDLDAKRAIVEDQPVDYYTSVIMHEDIRLLETLETRDVIAAFRSQSGPGDPSSLRSLGMTAPSVITRESDDREPAPSPSRGITGSSPPLGLSLSLGRVQVTERYTGYKVKRHDQVLATHPLDLPPTEFPTIGLWLTFDSPSLSHSNPGILDPSTPFLSGLHGAEHALIAIAPLIAMCDPRDFGGASYPLFPGTGKPTILIYDGFENGIGISEKLYAEFERWARTAHDLVARCPCDEGCPACVLSPRCGDGNQPMDKRAALEVLAQLVVTSTSLH